MAEVEWVYLNGTFLPKHAAHISVEDRGTLFADGVYEVVRYYAGTPLAIDRHVQRLRRSLAGIRLGDAVDAEALAAVSDEVLQRNGLHDAKVYWQITRGPAVRDHRFPADSRPTQLVMAYPIAALDRQAPPRTVRAIMAEDRRWPDCWIKSLMLLPNVLARQRAAEAGCDEAILYRGQVVTEGTSTSVLIVRDGTVWTHPADGAILPGVTRGLLIDLARQADIDVREKPFTLGQLRQADEILLCGTTTEVAAAIEVDGRRVGDGAVGPVTRRLHEALGKHISAACGMD